MGKVSQEVRAKIFKDTIDLCRTNEKLMDSVLYSKKHQEVLTEELKISGLLHKGRMPAKVLVSQKRSIEAASQYIGRKVCVLNFASSTNPGGGVANGSNAQEEAICRCSTLYACISDKDIAGSFYDRHRQKLKGGQLSLLYNDDCIYTPRVTVFKTDTERPELLPETSWYDVDIISCAAPNLRIRTCRKMDCFNDEADNIGLDGLLDLHKKRIDRILSIVKMNHVEVMILGAFGCGAFKNPPEIVAWAMLDTVRNYLCDFSVVEFAVYNPPHDTKNFDVFKRILAPICE